MRSALSSPRRRRRLAWLVAIVLALASIAAGVSYLQKPSEPESTLRSGAPASWRVADTPQTVQHTLASRQEALTVAARFIDTAVARKRVGDSWQLLAPSLKAGYTKASWSRGDIPVVPFPVREAKWQLDYSFRDSIGLKVALFPRPGTGQRATVFNVDLVAASPGSDRRWLVESFQPNALQAVQGGSTLSAAGFPNLGGGGAGESRLGLAWMLLPLGILSLVLIVPLAIVIRAWYCGVRAQREYARGRV